jgi:hypothetical protein
MEMLEENEYLETKSLLGMIERRDFVLVGENESCRSQCVLQTVGKT